MFEARHKPNDHRRKSLVDIEEVRWLEGFEQLERLELAIMARASSRWLAARNSLSA
jgi:hypothetical protein